MTISLRRIGALIRLLIFFVMVLLSSVQLLTWFFQWLGPFHHSAEVKGAAVFVSAQQENGSFSEDPLDRLKWFYLTGE